MTRELSPGRDGTTESRHNDSGKTFYSHSVHDAQTATADLPESREKTGRKLVEMIFHFGLRRQSATRRGQMKALIFGGSKHACNEWNGLLNLFHV